MIVLAEPNLDDKEQVINYTNEFLQTNAVVNGGGGIEHFIDDYENWVENINNKRKGKDIFSSTYFTKTMDQDKIVGMFTYVYNETEEVFLSYGVRPSERKKGYGTEMLYLAKQKGEELGFEKITIMCDINNVPSSKVINKHQGTIEEIDKESGKFKYVIDLRQENVLKR